MPRTSRVAPGGMVFHVLNRGVARMQLFEKAVDYQAFEQDLQDTLDQSPMRICAYAVMPRQRLAPAFVAGVRWRVGGLHATADDHPCAVAGKNTGAMRDWAMSTKVDTSRSQWKATSISGLWPDTLSAMRCAAHLVLRAEEWRWSSLWQRCHPTGEERSLLAAWPIDMPANWLERVNEKPTTRRNGSASPQRATRPPLWPAGMAEGIANVWA